MLTLKFASAQRADKLLPDRTWSYSHPAGKYLKQRHMHDEQQVHFHVSNNPRFCQVHRQFVHSA